MIAAVAIRTVTVVLHRDRDFHVLDDIAPDLRCQSLLE
ncbi:putative nucleic acid-binding protein [Haloactinomyces albus]|uniref:Nucleic acid-binding protein n=1 Tax=Haloactinomyces albus TaxID=1352928 RepID=A0AAE4CKJ0_9ACTN|nr:putative nucleic acid-binding protein [Haloactinomyces albus]